MDKPGLPESEESQLQPQDDSQLELELGIPKTLRTEFNFLKFPFFDLARNSQRAKIEIQEDISTKEGDFQIRWLVARSIEGNFPGDFEKRLHRAIEQIINIKPKPITNPLRLGSLRYIAKLMAIHPDSGKNYADIKKAFKNIVSATIETKGTFQLKTDSKNKKSLDDTFHLYDRVIFKDEEISDGLKADAVFLMLGSWYLNNINKNYVVPLDWHFYTQLSGNITTRMYEYMSIYFYAALERQQKYYDVRYSQICSYFPLVSQNPAWKARKQLKKSHESLVAHEYIAKVEWLETLEPKDWLLRYWIGPRAIKEYNDNKKELKSLGVTLSKPFIPERRRRKQITRTTQDGSDNELLASFKSRGLTTSVAEKILKEHSEEDIKHKIRVFDWLVKNNKVEKNPAGFLRQSITDDYADPPGYISPRERQHQAQVAQQQRQEEFSQQYQEYRHWLTCTPEEREEPFLHNVAITKFRLKHKREPKQYEINEMQQELVANQPSLTEKQKEIFGKVLFRATTIQELESEFNKLNQQLFNKTK